MKLKSAAVKAFTLIEVLLVIGFVALAAAGVYVTYSKVETASKVNTESTYLNTISAGVRKLYSGSKYPAAGTDMRQTLLDAKVIPDKLIGATAPAIENSFGGAITVTSRDVDAGAGTSLGFEIAIDALPSDVCTQLASELQLNFTHIGIGANAAGATTNAAGATAIKGGSAANTFDPAVAATACGAQTSSAIAFQGR